MGFHNCPDVDKWEFIQRINSKRVKCLAERVLFRNFKTDGCPVSLEESFNEYIKRVFSSLEKDAIKGFRGDEKLTCEGAIAEMEKLEAEAKA